MTERPALGTAHRRGGAAWLVALAIPVAACHPSREQDRAVSFVRLGQIALTQHACGSCHRISGIQGADGRVGPPLVDYARRRMIAGVLPNTPVNLARYLKAPRTVVPGNMMPQEALGDREIQGIVAYLGRH
ncbi:cytochrome C [Sphingomonas sp. MMSM20]|uniref:c-type cytochrome n=1 Tax=Sphingomonas lycopersici TaxID=2951807 RepID=UPI0022379F7C|nr:c-type cytochrome [Sphingomonas lycopersici]MCW6528928.1 cytochrome C [Sphingomonas lycopersici]